MKINGLYLFITLFIVIFSSCTTSEPLDTRRSLREDLPADFQNNSIYSEETDGVIQSFTFKILSDTSLLYYLKVSRNNCSQLYSGKAFIDKRGSNSITSGNANTYLVNTKSSFYSITISANQPNWVKLKFLHTESGDCIGTDDVYLKPES